MRSEQQEHHTLVLEQTYPSGAEEWYCPECGRRFVMQWPPAYKRIILEAGNEFAIHNAAKDALNIDTPQVRLDLQADSEKEPGLAPWQEWMEKTNFDRLWEN